MAWTVNGTIRAKSGKFPGPNASIESGPGFLFLGFCHNGGMSRILIVDDDGEALGILEGLLVESGHEVAVLANGHVAVDRIQREPFDLVLLDLSTPSIDGLESLREIKRHQPKLPVIVVTGQGTMEPTSDRIGRFAE